MATEPLVPQPSESTSEFILRVLLETKNFIGDFPTPAELADILDTNIKLDRLLQQMEALETRLTAVETLVTAIKENTDPPEEENS